MNPEKPRQPTFRRILVWEVRFLLAIVVTVLAVVAGQRLLRDRPEEQRPPRERPPLDGPMVTVFVPVRGKDPASPSKRLKEILAELDRTDPGWRLEDLETARRQLDESENGALVVKAAAKKLPPEWKWKGPALSGRQPQIPFDAEEVEEFDAKLAEVGEALAEARQLERYPQGRFRLVIATDGASTLLRHIQQIEQVTDLLVADATHKTQIRDGAAALRSVRPALHALRSIEDESIAVSQIVRLKQYETVLNALERVVALPTPPPEDALQSIQEALEEEIDKPFLARMLRYERASCHYALTNLQNDDVDSDLRKFRRSSQPLSESHVWLLERYAGMLSLASLPYDQHSGKLYLLFLSTEDDPIVGRAFLVNPVKLASYHHKGLARLRTATIGLAVERYRRKHGRWPEKLDALVPEFIKALPADSYRGGPFRSAVRPEGFVIYTLGESDEDEGGSFDSINQSPDGNLGFRVVDPMLRK